MEQTLQKLSIKLFPPKTLQNCIDSFFHDHPKSTLSWIIKKGLQSVCVFLFVYRSLLMCLTWPPKNETLPLCSRLRKVGYLSWFAERKKQKKGKEKSAGVFRDCEGPVGAPLPASQWGAGQCARRYQWSRPLGSRKSAAWKASTAGH